MQKRSYPTDILAQTVERSSPPQDEIEPAVSEENPSLVLSGNALAVAFTGLLSAVFLVSKNRLIKNPTPGTAAHLLSHLY